MGKLNVHTCHAIGCATPVPAKMFMCLKHWRMVPRPAQTDIWRHYIPGQEIRKDPTSDYMKAVQRAQAMVLMKERGIDVREAATVVLREYGIEPTQAEKGLQVEKS